MGGVEPNSTTVTIGAQPDNARDEEPHPSDSFVVQVLALAEAPGLSVGYTVLVDEEPVSGGRFPCHGGPGERHSHCGPLDLWR